MVRIELFYHLQLETTNNVNKGGQYKQIYSDPHLPAGSGADCPRSLACSTLPASDRSGEEQNGDISARGAILSPLP